MTIYHVHQGARLVVQWRWKPSTWHRFSFRRHLSVHDEVDNIDFGAITDFGFGPIFIVYFHRSPYEGMIR
jgi:hypothetical protein